MNPIPIEPPDTMVKLATQGGPVLVTLMLTAILFIRYILPLMQKALQTHQEDLHKLVDSHVVQQATLVTDHRVAQREALASHRETTALLLDQGERRYQHLIDGVAADVKGIRQELDGLGDKVIEVHAHVTGSRVTKKDA